MFADDRICSAKVGNYVLMIFGLITSFELISFSPIKLSTISLLVWNMAIEMHKLPIKNR